MKLTQSRCKAASWKRLDCRAALVILDSLDCRLSTFKAIHIQCVEALVRNHEGYSGSAVLCDIKYGRRALHLS